MVSKQHYQHKESNMGRRISLGTAPGGPTLPYGPEADRPDGAGAGSLRFNTDRNFLELYNGTAWLPVGSFETVSTASNVTAHAGQQIFMDTSSGGRTITLPSSPAVGDTIRVFDSNKTFDSNACTIARNGERIMGDTADMTVDSEGASFDLIYSGSAQGWRLLSV